MTPSTPYYRIVDPGYPAARAVAARVQEHFARHLAAARQAGRRGLATEPDVAAIEALIDVAFWASLRREEGMTPRISLAFVSPADAGQAMTFAERLPLQATELARLAPAVERPGIHLGVWRDDSRLQVWGMTRDLPPFCLVVEVVASGLLVVKHRPEPFGKFINVAVLEGDAIKIIDEGGASIPDCPALLKSLLGFESPIRGGELNVLVQLAASMRAHHRGGTLLVVPSGSNQWQASIVSPVHYSVSPPFSVLSDLIRRSGTEAAHHEWQEDLRRAVDEIAGLTAVDGATLLNDAHELLAFGAKITRLRGSPPVERVLVTEPVLGVEPVSTTPVQLGGTRHLSAAQFVHDQRDTMALVASQDGRFTIFQWSPCDEVVHGHRVEALLL